MIEALVLSVAAAAAPQPTSVGLQYDLRVAGIGVAQIRVAATTTREAYAVVAQGETNGPADWIAGLVLGATSAGAVRGGEIHPLTHAADNRYEGEERRVRLRWDGEIPSALEVVPSQAEDERTPIPPDALPGAVDPIAAVLRFAAGPPREGRCEGEQKVFDGRRSYTLGLSLGDEGGIDAIDVGGTDIQALKCRVTMTRTGGRSPDPWPFRSADVEEAWLWFWTSPQGWAIPVRFEADAPVGYAVGELAELPK